MDKRGEKIFITILGIVLLFSSLYSFGQSTFNLVEGKVSYMSSQNIYVKFENTLGIENGDTIFIDKNGRFKPILIILHHSSISCLGNYISDEKLQMNDKVYAKIETDQIKNEIKNVPENEVEKDVNEEVLTTSNPKIITNEWKQNINGRISVSSYSNLSSHDNYDYHRLRYRFSLNAENISDSKVSAETYITFSHKINEWDAVKENIFNALKIYSLALSYDFTNNTKVWLGRKINPVIANVGAIDGIQFEHKFGNFYTGVAVGSRPDYSDYSFNPDLFEIGAYIGHSQKVDIGFTQTSLALFEQRNQLKTDRRFVYFQHSNTLLKDLALFSSFEIDLYKLEEGSPKNSLSITSFYFSLRYKVTKRLSMFGSYDSRKNVIYYETFKNYSDEILQQASRQGLRFRVNYRPTNFLNIGLNAGTRLSNDDVRATNTLNGIVSYTNVPVIKSLLTLSANLMQTAYLDGIMYDARLSKDIIPGKLYTMLNYRRVNFNYLSTNSQLIQNIGEADLSYHFNKKLYLSVNYEVTLQKDDNFNRIYLHLRRNF